MHQYLRSIGFSNIKTNKDLQEIVSLVINEPDHKEYIETDRNSTIVEFIKYFSPSSGIVVRGEIDEDNKLSLDFYYPICKAYELSTCEEINIERYAAHESFAGVCDDPRIGVTIIFDIQNCVDIMKLLSSESKSDKELNVNFSGMSLNGTIMLPIKKNEKEKEIIQKNVNNRNKLIVAARNGDENAIESLTLDDIDTYAMISKKIRNEDIYSLVDSYFMPYGVECDQYSLMGEIEEFFTEKNECTNEEMYVLKINYNDMSFNVCINKEDLLGEPMVGRRFKGVVLMQGKINIG